MLLLIHRQKAAPMFFHRKSLSTALAAVALFMTIVPGASYATAGDDWMEDPPAKISPAARQADNSDTNQDSSGASEPHYLQGGLTYCVPKGTAIKLKLATVPTFGMNMLQRDLDGKLVPAKDGEEISARTTEDIFVDDNKAIPAGTIFHGCVKKVIAPGRVGQKGWVQLSFDAFQTPDGRRFAFQAQANNRGHSTTKSKAKRTGYVLSYAAGGAVVGALIAYQVCGLQETIAMHGYNIAGAAAAGALAGSAYALLRHGPQAVLEPGDDLSMEIDTDMLIPAATTPTVKAPPICLPGLQIKILSSKVIDDGLDGKQLKLKVHIDNNTNRRLQSIDLFVEDDNGGRYSLVTDPQEDKSDMLFTVDPYSSQDMVLDFGLEYPKLKRKLVWLDKGSRQPLFEERLP
jgi:hypothetical protein